MPKIKNWTKQSGYSRGNIQGYEASWKNEKTGDTIFLKTAAWGGDSSYYSVEGRKINKGRFASNVQKVLKTRIKGFKSARKYAVKWMRKHPNGFSR